MLEQINQPTDIILVEGLKTMQIPKIEVHRKEISNELLHNKDKNIDNLYFSAAGSHPGAGIPGVLCSAKIIEKLIRKDFGIS